MDYDNLVEISLHCLYSFSLIAYLFKMISPPEYRNVLIHDSPYSLLVHWQIALYQLNHYFLVLFIAN